MWLKKQHVVVLLVLGFCVPALAGGFFEVLYAPTVIQDEDLEALDDAVGYGLQFGYEKKLGLSGVILNIEFGYEMSTHEIEPPFDDPDYYYRNHRGFLGARLKYGGWGYVQPYVGFGTMAYVYYEASDALAADLSALDFEIASNLSGSYLVGGLDFSFSQDSKFRLGLEHRTMNYTVKDTDTGDSELDVKVSRLGAKFSVSF